MPHPKDLNPFDSLTFIMKVEEDGPDSMPPEELASGVQHMIDSGLCWQLQGYWGRLATSLIESGDCHR